MMMLRGRFAILTMCVICLMPLRGASANAEAAQVSAEGALQALPQTTWYDKKSRRFAPPRIPPARDNSLRAEGWRATVRPPRETWDFWKNWNWKWTWPSVRGNWFSGIVLTLLGTLLVTIIVVLTWFAMRDYVPGRRGRSSRAKSIEIDPSRIVDLPFEVRASNVDPLVEADRLRQAGKYNEAVIYLCGYLLLALDRQRRIHLQKGKTNRMYLRELNAQGGLREILQLAMLAFEDSFFGKHELSRQRFESIWQRLDEFHQRVASQVASGLVSGMEGNAK